MKSIVITGGGSGIGRALVEHYHREGWRVLTCGRREAPLRGLENELPGVAVVVADVATPNGRNAIFERAKNSFGAVRGLINNAGIQHSYHVASGNEHQAELQQEVMVNLVAPIALIYTMYPLMEQQAGAFVVNVSSGLAYLPHGRAPVYCASKAGLSQYTKAVRFQNTPLRFVEAVVPLVDTPMTAGRGSRKLSAKATARLIADGVRSGKKTLWIGQSRLIPRVERVVPGLLARLMNRGEAAASE